MRSLRALIHRCEAALLDSGESPERAALAFAVGVFLSFSPLLGLQIITAATLALLFRLNKVLLFIGLCTNLPWLVAPYYAATTEGAARLMGVSPPSRLAAQFSDVFAHSVLSDAFWRAVVDLVWPLLLPFLVGSTVAAAILALIAYRVGLVLARSRRQRT